MSLLTGKAEPDPDDMPDRVKRLPNAATVAARMRRNAVPRHRVEQDQAAAITTSPVARQITQSRQPVGIGGQLARGQAEIDRSIRTAHQRFDVGIGPPPDDLESRAIDAVDRRVEAEVDVPEMFGECGSAHDRHAKVRELVLLRTTFDVLPDQPAVQVTTGLVELVSVEERPDLSAPQRSEDLDARPYCHPPDRCSRHRELPRGVDVGR